jgi:glutaminyl-peptide cyclotransferase
VTLRQRAKRRIRLTPSSIPVRSVLVVAVVLTLVLPFGGPAESGTRDPSEARTEQAEVLRLGVKVREVLPHDPGAFTQGLLWHDGRLYESTGEFGTSSVRRIDPATGTVEKEISLADDLFGEGLALIDERLIQLTWQRGVALVYDLETFEEIDRYSYDGEGWGLCYDGYRLYMSNGTATLSIRERESFDEVDLLQVTLEGRPLGALNELECAEGWIYANVYQTDAIVRIDPLSGEVRAVIHAAELLSPEERAAADVLNGIAYRGDTSSFLLTGKYWPSIFEVEFTPLASRP